VEFLGGATAFEKAVAEKFRGARVFGFVFALACRGVAIPALEADAVALELVVRSSMGSIVPEKVASFLCAISAVEEGVTLSFELLQAEWCGGLQCVVVVRCVCKQISR